MKACFSRCLLLTESERSFYESLSKERGRWLNLFVCIQAICELSQLICVSVTQTTTNWDNGSNEFQIVQAVSFFLNAILISLFQFNVISYRAGTFWFSLVEILRVCGSCRVKVLLSSPLDGVLLGYSCVSAVAAVSLSCSIIFQAVGLFVLHVAVMMSTVEFTVIRILTTLLLYLLILSMLIVQLKLTQRDFKLRQHQQAMILTLESMIQVPVILSRFNEREETIELQSVNNAGKAILKVNDLSTLNSMLSQTQLNPLGSNSKPHRNTLPPNNLKTKVRALIDHLRDPKKSMNPMNFLRLASPISQSQKSIMPSPLYLPSRNSLAQQSNCSQHQSALMKASFSPTKRSPLRFNKSFFRRTSNLPSTHLLPPLRSSSNPPPSPLPISHQKRRSSDISISITPNCSTPLRSSSADRRPRRNRKNELFKESSNNSSTNPNSKGAQSSAISNSNASSFYGYMRQDDSSKEERVLIRMWGYYLSEAYVILVVESEADSGKLARERAKQRTFEQECRRFSNELGSMSRILFASLRNKQISLMKTEVQQWQNRNHHHHQHQHKQPYSPSESTAAGSPPNTNSIQGIIKNSSSIQSNLLCLGQCFKLINCVDNFILSHDSLSGWLLAEKELKNVSLKTILTNLLEVIAPTQKKRTIKSAVFFQQDSQSNYHHSTKINYSNDYNHPSSSTPSHDPKSNAWMIQSSPKHLTQLLFNILNLSFQLCADDGIVQVQISQSKTQQSLIVSVRHSIGDESFSIFNFTEQQQQAFETSQKILRIVSPYSKFFIKQRVKCYAQIKFFVYEDLSQISEIVRNHRRTVCSKGELENNDQLIEQEDESPSENLSILETIDPLIQEISKMEVVHEGRKSFQVGRVGELEENQKENEIVLTENFEDDLRSKQIKMNTPLHIRQTSFEKTEIQEKYKIKEAENEDESSSESSSSSVVSSQEGKTQKNTKTQFPQRSSLLFQQQSNPSSPPSIFLSSRVPSQHRISFRCQQSLHRNSLKNIKGNLPGFSGGPSNTSIRGKSEKSIEVDELEIEYLPWIRISADETDKAVSPNLAILKNKPEKKQDQSQKTAQHFFGSSSGFHTSPTNNSHFLSHESANSARQSHKIVDLEQSWQPSSISGNNEESQKQQEPNEEATQEEPRIPWTRKPRQKIRKHTNRDEIKEDLDYNGY